MSEIMGKVHEYRVHWIEESESNGRGFAGRRVRRNPLIDIQVIFDTVMEIMSLPNERHHLGGV